MQDVLHVEDEILAEAEGRVHAQMMRFQDVPPEQLVPAHPVIVVRRAPGHILGILLPCDEPVLVNGPFDRRALPHYPVKIAHHHIRPAFLRRALHVHERLRRQPVVRIHELDVLSTGQVHALVAGVADP